jgi:predicted RNase H-like HicB family nuclease
VGEVIVTLEPGDKGGFHAWVLELPDCHSRGETEVEALRNIAEAIESYKAARPGADGDQPEPEVDEWLAAESDKALHDRRRSNEEAKAALGL